jgi:hypothetical protein
MTMPKPVMNPATAKVAIKIAIVMLTIAAGVVAQIEAGTITDAAGFVLALAKALTGALGDEP